MDVYIPNKYCPCTRCRMSKMMLPVLLVTLGTLSLIDEFYGMRSGTFVALVLIVFGGVRLVQSSAAAVDHSNPGVLPTSEIPPVPEAQAATTPEVQNG